ncbi:MAG: phosphopyruvate hydratase, partial [Elusimicrobia bacterium]|nr:phosphopyruvate hydratase [Elusimicrobiota bacterium]
AGRAAVPSGASTGEHEAVELRDGDAKRFHGKGVLKAVANATGALKKAVAGRDAEDQEGADEAMNAADGTPNKGKLGANAILAVSMALSRAAASKASVPLYEWLRTAFGIKSSEYLLPAPMLNVINGGKHADSGLDVQEFMLVPTGAASFSEALRLGAEAYQTLKKLLASRKESTAVGDEGGFAPRLKSNEEALRVLQEALGLAGSSDKIKLALDAAASEFHDGTAYRFDGKPLAPEMMVERWSEWLAKYPIISLEDPLDEDDWGAWKLLTGRCGRRARIVGDDLFVTNLLRLERGIKESAGNSILIKLNQIGTVTETVRAVRRAQDAGFSAIISHRSGETEDPYIADLSVALNAGAIKTGAPCRSERLAKYNQLLRIEAELGPKARYAGERSFRLTAAAAA